MPDLPQEFGPYTLQELIARGGMAEIYRASMPGIGGFEKTVAIKKILPHLAEDDEFIDMLVDEAQIIEKLDHANIAQVFDLGAIDGSYYIAMEYIHGVDLSAIIAELAEHDALLPYEHTAHILANVCDGLHFAHNKSDADGDPLNVIHRDISPHNVMLSFAGDVKIIDFGVAKAADRKNKTESGTIKGKLLYMAPEQAKSDDALDGRADLFAVGLCGYNMLTDTLPFRGDNEFEVYDNVLNADIPPPRQLQPDVPQQLNDIVMKLLNRDPDQRYQSGYEAQQAFEAALHDIAPGYTVNRLSNFVEDNFSHLLHEQSAADSSAPDSIPDRTPEPGRRTTDQRDLDAFPAKADTSGDSAQRKARRQRADDSAPASDPHREAAAESVPDDDIHGESTRAVDPSELAAPDSNPAASPNPPGASQPDAGSDSPPSTSRPGESTGQLDENALAAEPTDDSNQSGLTTNQFLLIGSGLLFAGIVGVGGYLVVSPNRSLQSPSATPSAVANSNNTQPDRASASNDSQPTSASDKHSPTGSGTSDDDPSAAQPPSQNNAQPAESDSSGTIVSIDSVPSGADIVRNGNTLGTTPHNIPVDNADGPIDITLKKQGFSERSVQFLPVDGAQKTFDLSEKSTDDKPSGPSDDDTDEPSGSTTTANEEPNKETGSPPARSTTDESSGSETSAPSKTSDESTDDSPPAESAANTTDSADDSTGGESAGQNKSDDDNAKNSDDENSKDKDIIDPFAQ
jgi:serine/threonine protein kinase